MGDEVNHTELVKQSVPKVIQAAQSMDDAALAALLAAEQAGQKRSTLIEWIEGEQKERASLPGNGTDTEAYLAGELEKLGYARDGGPIDASYAQKAIFALAGVSADRDALKDELTSTGDALKLSQEQSTTDQVTISDLRSRIAVLEADAADLDAEIGQLKADPVVSVNDHIETLFGGRAGGGKTYALTGDDPLRNDDFDGFIPLNGAAVVLFDAEGKRIGTIDARRFGSSQFRRSGRSTTLDADIEFAPTLGEVEVAGAVLVEFDDDDVSDGFARSTLVQPFGVGGGRNAKLPAGTLTFR